MSSSVRHWPKLAAVAALSAVLMATLLALLVYHLLPPRTAAPTSIVQATDPPPDRPPLCDGATARSRTGEIESFKPVADSRPPRPDTGKAQPAAPVDRPPSKPKSEPADAP